MRSFLRVHRQSALTVVSVITAVAVGLSLRLVPEPWTTRQVKITGTDVTSFYFRLKLDLKCGEFNSN
jgi:hypothetical protein